MYHLSFIQFAVRVIFWQCCLVISHWNLLIIQHRYYFLLQNWICLWKIKNNMSNFCVILKAGFNSLPELLVWL